MTATSTQPSALGQIDELIAGAHRQQDEARAETRDATEKAFAEVMTLYKGVVVEAVQSGNIPVEPKLAALLESVNKSLDDFRRDVAELVSWRVRIEDLSHRDSFLFSHSSHEEMSATDYLFPYVVVKPDDISEQLRKHSVRLELFQKHRNRGTNPIDGNQMSFQFAQAQIEMHAEQVKLYREAEQAIEAARRRDAKSRERAEEAWEKLDWRGYVLVKYIDPLLY